MNGALGILDADDQHVLGEPTLGARLPTRNAQGVAFLAEQRVAAVARTEALDRQLFGEMHDEAAFGVQIAGRMQAFDEAAVAADALECGSAHARHQLHVEHDVGAVGDFDAATRERRIDRAHAIRHDIERAALHAAAKQIVHLTMRLGRREPMVVRPRVLAALGANKGQMFDARDIGRVGAIQIAAWKARPIERQEFLGRDQLPFQGLVLGVAAIAPINAVW